MGTWDCAGRAMLWQVQKLGQKLGAGACGTCEASEILWGRCLAALAGLCGPCARGLAQVAPCAWPAGRHP